MEGKKKKEEEEEERKKVTSRSTEELVLKKNCHWLIKVNIATFIISGNDVFRGRRIIKNTSQSISRISLLSFVLF